MSDSGVSTEYDRYIRQASELDSPASDVGAMSVSDQIRRYNSRRHHNADPALEFVDEYNHEQLSFGTRNSSQPIVALKDDRVLKARQFYSPDRSSSERRPRSSTQKKSPPQYYGDVRSKFKAMHQQNMSRQGPISGDPDESFGSSVETPSLPSIRELKMQLWNEREVLQVGGVSMGRLDQKLERHSRPSRSLSPAHRILADTTFDSENSGTSSFKSKYVEAAMVAREREQASISNHHQRNDPRANPVTPRKVISRPRTSSGGEETQVSAFSSPYDEGGRSGGQPSARSNARPPSLDIPPLHSSFDEYGEKGSVERYNRPPPPHEQSSSRLSPFAEQEGAHSRNQRTSIDGGVGYEDGGNVLARSLSRERMQDHYVRPPSPLIQQRVREFSQESRGRTPSRTGSVTVGSRSYSHEPRSRTIPEAPVGRSLNEFGRETTQTNSRPLSIAPSTQRPTTASSFLYGSEKALQHNTIRRITTIRDAPSKRSSSLDRRPPTPINQSTLLDAPSQTSQQESNDTGGSRSQQHAEIAAYWQEKARASPTFPMPEHPVALMNQSSDYARRLHNFEKEARALTSESGSSHSDQQHVSDLVAKLSAVNRANPAEALAQIDSILRQEARSTSTEPDYGARGGMSEGSGKRESPNDFVDGETVPEMDEDSDDDTSVSSITNPTFQGYVKPSQNQLAMDQGVRPSNLFAPSTSSFRRPRPSGLQSYIPTNLQQQQDASPRHTHAEGTSTSKAKERREQLRQYPPPLTIKVRDSQEPNMLLPRPRENEDRFRITVTENRNAHWSPPNSPTYDDNHVKVTVTHQDSNRNTPIQDKNTVQSSEPDVHLPETKMLEAKIRGRDETSQSMKKTVTPNHVKKDDPPARDRVTVPAPTRRHRAHPWDDEIPAHTEKVDTHETSMDNAAGVEAAMPHRQAMRADDRLLHSSEVSLTEERSKPIITPHTMAAIRQKSLLEAFPDDPALLLNPMPQDRRWGGRHHEIMPEKERTHNPIGLWAAVQDDFPGETPLIHDPQPSPRNAQRESWLLPPKNDTPQKKEPRPRGGPVDLDQSIDTNRSPMQGTRAPAQPARLLDDRERSREDMDRGAIEVSLLSVEDDSEFVDTSGDTDFVDTSGDTDNLGVTQARQHIPRQEPNNKTKRRSFFRVFNRKDKQKDKAHMPKQAALHGSMPSAGNDRATPQIRLQPLSKAYHPEPIVDHKRGRSEMGYGGPAQRSRSASMERFRSSNMAQKFGKVLRLYDQD